MISKELFVEVIEDARKTDDYQNCLNNQLRENGVEGFIFQPTCVDSVIKLLHFSFLDSDSSEMISYFCFDLDYGRKWKPGMIKAKDDTDINLSTPEHLYDYLNSQNN